MQGTLSQTDDTYTEIPHICRLNQWKEIATLDPLEYETEQKGFQHDIGDFYQQIQSLEARDN